MNIKQTTIALCVMSLSAICLQKVFAAGTSQITDNGRTATLTLPLKATITADNILRDTILVTPLSSLYEIVKWDPVNKRFNTHEFLFRVSKDSAVPVLFEILGDQYTCRINNPGGKEPQPADIAVINAGYKYSVSWSGKIRDMGSTRSVTVDDKSAWLTTVNGTDRFIDLTLNITFPDVSAYPMLMNMGGACRGSVTMLLSNKL